MPRPHKVWIGILHAWPSDDARHRDGRPAAQVRAAVRASSQKAAAAALGVSLGFLRDYFGDTFRSEDEAIFLHPPLTVMVHPLDPGDSVRGQHGWVPR